MKDSAIARNVKSQSWAGVLRIRLAALNRERGNMCVAHCRHRGERFTEKLITYGLPIHPQGVLNAARRKISNRFGHGFAMLGNEIAKEDDAPQHRDGCRVLLAPSAGL